MIAAAHPVPRRGGPLRFLGASVGGWVLTRIVVVAMFVPAAALIPHAAREVRRIVVPPARPGPPPPSAALMPIVPRPVAHGAAVAMPRHAPPTAPAPIAMDLVGRFADAILIAPYAPGSAHVFGRIDEGQAEAFAAPPGGRAPLPGRWSAQAYLFARGGRVRALSPGGQLGGSQAGLRIVRRIGRHAAIALRVSAPARDPAGAEAAVGLDWVPFGFETPLRVSAERRVALGRDARDAWSAYVAGGLYEVIGKALVLDGYAQAGVVGARRRDLFADGALRAGRAVQVGPSERLTVGAGAWGAAQPRAERLDIGPRAALSLPLGPQATGVVALEGRFRVAGAAQPGSGIALTLATDF